MSMFLTNIFEEFLGTPRKHNEIRHQISFDCPACAMDKGVVSDGKGNLEINYNKGLFKCWVCHNYNGMRGYIPKLIAKWGTSAQLKEYKALKPDYAEYSMSDEVREEVKLPEGFKKLINCDPYRDYGCAEAKKYLKNRGIGDDIIEEYNIGYTVKGKMKGRIIIPSYDEMGELNYFIARTYEKRKGKKKLLSYINPEANKQIIVFNENKVNWDSTIYLVEGAFDHIVTPNSIPLLGKVVSDKLEQLLHNKAAGYVVILLDEDAKEDAKSLYKKLNKGDLAGRIRVCSPPYGYDPSKIYELLGTKGIVGLLKRSEILSDEA